MTNTPKAASEAVPDGSRTDWFAIANNLDSAARHIATLAALASMRLSDNLARIPGDSDDRPYEIPFHCVDDIYALLRAIEDVATRAQEPPR